MCLLRFFSIRFSRSVWVGALTATIVLFGIEGLAVAQAQNTALTFNNGGFIQNIIKAASAADFEMVMGRVKEGLQNSDDSAKRRQADSWKMYKLAGVNNGNVTYIMIIDPPVSQANYTVSTILFEAYGQEEAQRLYDIYSGAAAGYGAVESDPVSSFNR
tara:strand:+ start:93 stop:569 length:477 start_codon:yes stop_codon:yes gene_type:complete